MQEKFYYNKLYSFQDEVLKLIDLAETDFYLTGGTALSRVYLKHRYSDDLDFFINNSNKFSTFVNKINNILTKQYKEKIEIITTADSFVRLHLKKDDIILKIDFVNDIEYRFGQLIKWEKFSKIDNQFNILSNKISALPRYAEKDVADILFLAYHFNFNWEDIINDAQKKDIWVNAIDVSKIIDSFPIEKFSEIKWISKVKEEMLFNDLKIVAKEILIGSDNSLKK
ncbi:MAG: hypothetical protein A2X08_00640 [Bacteroidetes bacterium GWA2_32_17]|nr:MAG: hypothetical protein A2X08_00640 [Bacteroidetes bacterium GWA2_32_17]